MNRGRDVDFLCGPSKMSAKDQNQGNVKHTGGGLEK
jgi:hypothetical protein